MTAQDYVNQALSAGLSQGTIDSFIAYNPNDYGRIWSAFNLGGSTTSTGYQSTTTAYIPPAPGGSMSDPNPAASLYASTVAAAASAAQGATPIASDEVLTITGTLGGVLPEHISELPGMGGALVATRSSNGFDMSALIKIALLIVVASWAGSALFSGRNS